MSLTYTRSRTGKGHRVAMRISMTLGPKEVLCQIEALIRGIRREAAEAGFGEFELDAVVGETVLCSLNELADSYGVNPDTIRKELNDVSWGSSVGAYRACEAHLGKQCDCKLVRLLTVAQVQFLIPFCERSYHRNVRRHGAVRIKTFGMRKPEIPSSEAFNELVKESR